MGGDVAPVIYVVDEDKKNHLYKGRSIDGKTHYGENVLLISLLEQALLRQMDYIVN